MTGRDEGAHLSGRKECFFGGRKFEAKRGGGFGNRNRKGPGSNAFLYFFKNEKYFLRKKSREILLRRSALRAAVTYHRELKLEFCVPEGLNDRSRLRTVDGALARVTLY